MTESIREHEDGVWRRMRCPVCTGWLAVPTEFDADEYRPAERLTRRLTRRIEAFAHRHHHLVRNRAADTVEGD